MAYRGIRPRRTKTFERLEKIKLFHGMGMTTKEMAGLCDLSTSTVLGYLKELKLPPNRRNETNGIRSIKTLELCERCEFPDCVWNACMTLCPMQLKQKEATNH